MLTKDQLNVRLERKAILCLMTIMLAMLTCTGLKVSAIEETSYLFQYSFPADKNKIEATNATIYTSVRNPEHINVKKVGMYLYDNKGNLLKKKDEACDRSESPFNIYYNIHDDLAITLDPDTTYVYSFYVLYDGEEVKSERQSFTTLSKGTSTDSSTTANNNTEETQEAKDLLSFNFPSGKNKIEATNAELHASVTNPQHVTVREVGLYLYDKNGKLLKRLNEECDHSENPFTISYNIHDDVGMKLDPETRYSYAFYLVYNSEELKSQRRSFTTASRAMPTEIIVAIITAIAVIIAALIGRSHQKKEANDH